MVEGISNNVTNERQYSSSEIIITNINSFNFEFSCSSPTEVLVKYENTIITNSTAMQE